MAKWLHIVGALIVAITLRVLTEASGLHWASLPIGVLLAIYVLAVLFSPRTNPVPFSKPANAKYDAYLVYCSLEGKRPSQREYSQGAWKAEVAYPIDILATFRRLIDALINYIKNDQSLGRYKRLESTALAFVRACQAGALSDVEDVLADLTIQTWPQIQARDEKTLHSVVGHHIPK